MKYNELQTTPNKSRKRVGRGIAAGQGKTAGRGTKGQGSRTGSKFGATFMGGQGVLVQRIPKNRGFRSLRVKAQVVYTDQLNEVKGAIVDPTALYEAGLVATPYHTIKLIVRGEYTGKAIVRVQGASKGAVDMLTKAGGSFEPISVPIFPSSNKSRADKKTEIAEKRARN